jgi:hypothetical protein
MPNPLVTAMTQRQAVGALGVYLEAPTIAFGEHEATLGDVLQRILRNRVQYDLGLLRDAHLRGLAIDALNSVYMRFIGFVEYHAQRDVQVAKAVREMIKCENNIVIAQALSLLGGRSGMSAFESGLVSVMRSEFTNLANCVPYHHKSRYEAGGDLYRPAEADSETDSVVEEEVVKEE